MLQVIKIFQPRILILLLLASAIYGCASSSSFIAAHQLTVKKVSSEQTNIEDVYLLSVSPGLPQVERVL